MDWPLFSKDPMSRPSHLEETLAFQIRASALPQPLREYKAMADRRFRWDFAWPDHRLLVEVQGGIWLKSGHSSGGGITRDCTKLNLATLAGWHTFQVTKDHIESGEALLWIKTYLHQDGWD